MGKSRIEYRISVADNPGNAVTLWIDLDENGLTTRVEEQHQDWTDLRYHQCPGCPLTPLQVKQCPLAVRLSSLVNIFSEVASYDRVDVTAKVGRRTVTETVSVQQVLGSVLGLYFASSGCPHTAFFRPLALNHQPLATEAESVYRVISNYLTHQFIRMSEGEEPDLKLEGLQNIYDRMHEIHIHIAKRLRGVAGTEPLLNGITLLDTQAVSVPLKLQSSNNGFRDFYANYLADRERDLRGGEIFFANPRLEKPPVEPESDKVIQFA